MFRPTFFIHVITQKSPSIQIKVAFPNFKMVFLFHLQYSKNIYRKLGQLVQ